MALWSRGPSRLALLPGGTLDGPCPSLPSPLDREGAGPRSLFWGPPAVCTPSPHCGRRGKGGHVLRPSGPAGLGAEGTTGQWGQLSAALASVSLTPYSDAPLSSSLTRMTARDRGSLSLGLPWPVSPSDGVSHPSWWHLVAQSPRVEPTTWPRASGRPPGRGQCSHPLPRSKELASRNTAKLCPLWLVVHKYRPSFPRDPTSAQDKEFGLSMRQM